MSMLMICLAVNIIIAVLLEKNRKKIAVIFHVVLVALSLWIVFLWSPESTFEFTLSNMLGDETYKVVVNVLFWGNPSMMLPLAIVEMLLFVQTLFVVMFAVQRFVGDLFTHLRRNYTKLKGDDVEEKLPFVERWSKLYYLLQVIRC